jgi:hypothetical protein
VGSWLCGERFGFCCLRRYVRFKEASGMASDLSLDLCLGCMYWERADWFCLRQKLVSRRLSNLLLGLCWEGLNWISAARGNGLVSLFSLFSGGGWEGREDLEQSSGRLAFLMLIGVGER